MRRALFLLFLLPCLAVTAAARQEPKDPAAPSEGAAAGEDHAFLEMEVDRDACFVQEPIRLRLRIGVDAGFFRSNVIQPFARRLDVPVQLQASWLEELPGTVILESMEAAPGGAGGRAWLSFALNDGVIEAEWIEDRLRDGRSFTVLEIERSFLPLRPGGLVFPGPLLRYTYATRFQESLVNGRVPVDRHDALVSGGELTLRIRPLPAEGRPLEFTGAVGRFSVRAEADPRVLELGESLRLKLFIEGEGNLGFFDPPRLDLLEDFHVYGSIEDQDRMRRMVIYDMVPLSEEVREVPPIPFAFFDTRPPAGYRILNTPPIPIEVRPPPEGAPPGNLLGLGTGRAEPGVNDLFDLKPAAAEVRPGSPAGLSPALTACVLLAPWLLAIGLFFRLRARDRAASDPDGVRARRAAALFRRGIGRREENLAEAFAGYLAARLRCPVAAVIDPALDARLEAAGIPEERAAGAAALLEDLVAARYGGSAPPGGAEAVCSLVEALEASFRVQEEAR